MSKREKALERFRQNPKNVRFQEIESLLLGLGFTMRQRGTSHAFFKLGNHIINIPVKKPFVKRYYVELMITELERFFSEEDVQE